jgi:hypothetical protein
VEFLTILFSSLLTVISPVNTVSDTVIERELRDRLHGVEVLEVRIDNTPNYQVIRGKIDRFRLAGRGLYVLPDLRIDTLDIETDPIAVDLEKLRRGSRDRAVESLERPAIAAIHLVLTETDLNRALRSPEFLNTLQTVATEIFDSPLLRQNASRYTLVDPQIELLENNRIVFETQLAEKGYSDRLKLTIKTGFRWIDGRQLELSEPQVLVNDRPAPGQFVRGLNAVARRFNLDRAADRGIQARAIRVQIAGDRLETVLCVRSIATHSP